MKKTCLATIGIFTFFISRAQTVNYDVYALKYTSFARSSQIAQPAKASVGKDSVNIDFMVWLVKGNNGKNILVDAGFLYGPREAKDFDGINYLHPDSMLAKIDVRPEDITDIVLSRQHWSNIDIKNLFANAQLYIQKDDYNHFTRLSWQRGGINSEFNRKEVRNLVDANVAGRVTLLDKDTRDIIPGIKIYTDSGTMFNPQYVVVATSPYNLILSSTNTWVYYDLERSLPVPPTDTYDATRYIKVMEKVKTFIADAKNAAPAADTSLFASYPVPKEGIMKLE